MSRIRRDKWRRKLNEMLSLVPDAEFLILCWATHALQTGREAHVRGWFQYPQEAVVSDLSAPLAVFPWLIETLVNECLANPKDRLGRRVANVRRFEAMPPVRNALTQLENAEDSIMLARINVLDSFHLLAQRQFEWQRGIWNRPHLYRSGLIYGGEQTKLYFESARGFSLDEFTLTTFLLRALLLQSPTVNRKCDLSEFGISRETLWSVLDLISLKLSTARSHAHKLRVGPGHTAYKRSLLRIHPCIEDEEDILVGPLPDLVTLRGTTGIFYDIIDGPDSVKNEIARRFERYCLDFLTSTLRSFNISGEIRYRVRKGNEFASPDVLIRESGALSIIVECKATRMSYEARFSEVPVEADPRGYGEMARGVFQIWRFVSHVRRGLVPDERMGSRVCGLIVTLDNWLSMGKNMLGRLLDDATAMSVDREPGITAEDRIPIIFCPIEDVEQTISTATPSSFLASAQAAASDTYRGWMLSSVHNKINPDATEQNEYPFQDKISTVLPWWSRFGEAT